MTTVEIQYRPVRWLRYSKKIRTTHPDAWDELSPSQMISAASAMKQAISDEDLIAWMLGLKKRLVRRFSALQKLSAIELLKFLESYTPREEFIIPSIAGFDRPLPRLKNETFGCFIFAETFFDRYASTGDTEYLAKFIACYYRKGSFNEADVATRAEKIMKESAITQEAICINYFLIREWLSGSYPLVFRSAEDPTRKEKSSWLDVHDIIVGDDITKQKEYADLPISTVLRYLNNRIRKNLDESKIR